MSKYAIITDSTTYFTEEEFKKYDISRVSLNILKGDEAVRELEVDNDYVHKILQGGSRLTTSQPSPGEYLNLYEELIAKGVEKIFVLVISEKISGTYQSASISMNMLDDPSKVHLFSSNMAAYGNEMLLLQLIKLIEEDKKFEDIVTRMEDLISKTGLIFTTEDLLSLLRSGRLSKAKAMIGTMLKVKPTVKMEHGKLDLVGSARTHKKSFENMLNYMTEKIKDCKKLTIRVCNHNSVELADKLKEEVLSKYKNVEVTVSNYIGPVFNVHLGSKGYGISWIAE